jgi:thiol:disulfide interchange protein
MKHPLRLILLLVAGLLVLSVCQAGQEEKEPKEAVKKPAKKELFSDLNYTKALAQAKKDDKLVMLDFTTSWCGWCKKLNADTFSQAKVQQFLLDKAISIKVDGDKEQDLVKKYSVRGYPTLVFVDADGKEVGRIVGYRPPDLFLQTAKQELDRK